MVHIFGQSIRRPVLLLALVEAAAVFGVIFTIATLAVHSPYGPSGFTSAVAVPSLLIVLAMLALGTYEPNARGDFATMRERLSVACILGAIVGFGLVYVFGSLWVSPLYAVACASFSYLAVAITRILAGKVLNFAPLQRRVLVIGDDERKDAVVEVTSRSGSDVNLVDVMAPDTIEAPGRLAEITDTNDISEVIVTGRVNHAAGMALLDCKTNGVQIIDALDFCELETGQINLRNLYPERFIFARNSGHRRWARVAKRVIDFFVSLTAIVLLSPILLIAGLAVMLDSPGGAFYRQTRVGLNNKPYDIIKFRSMRQDAEASGKPQWAQESDPRITRVGNFLRQTRIDELPQLWNILRGEMSLVGPRPERPYFVEKLSETLPFYNERHRVKPGLTGWAQIMYRYGANEEDAKEKLRYDLYYVKNFNTALDVSIMARTVRVVLWPDGVH